MYFDRESYFEFNLTRYYEAYQRFRPAAESIGVPYQSLEPEGTRGVLMSSQRSTPGIRAPFKVRDDSQTTKVHGPTKIILRQHVQIVPSKIWNILSGKSMFMALSWAAAGKFPSGTIRASRFVRDVTVDGQSARLNFKL